MYPFEIIIKYVIFKPTRLDEIINDEWGLISKVLDTRKEMKGPKTDPWDIPTFNSRIEGEEPRAVTEEEQPGRQEENR